MMKTLRVRISGRVQGVCFRAWTMNEALALGLRGWVRNRRDGSVEALIAGPGAAVERMLARFHEGPPHAVVTGVEVDAADNEPVPDSIEQWRTV